MAEDIGLSGKLRLTDFERYYDPNLLSEEDQAKAFRQRKDMAEMTALLGREEPGLFPPRPGQEG